MVEILRILIRGSKTDARYDHVKYIVTDCNETYLGV